MARTFAGTSHRCAVSSPTVRPGTTGTISCWVKPNWNSGDSVWHAFWTWYGTNLHFSLSKYSDNQIYAGWINAGGGGGDDRIVLSDSGLFSSGVWANWVFTWDDAADVCTLYKDGTQVATRTSTLDTFDPTTSFTFGNYAATYTSLNADSDCAEYAQWSAVLDAAEIAAIAKGFSPLLLRPSARQHYYPVIGRYSPEIDLFGSADALTVTDAVVAAHPRILMPQPARVHYLTPAGGGLVGPLLGGRLLRRGALGGVLVR